MFPNTYQCKSEAHESELPPNIYTSLMRAMCDGTLGAELGVAVFDVVFATSDLVPITLDTRHVSLLLAPESISLSL
jgi:hypothetical protein